MLFTSLFTSALAVIGSVSAVPLEAGAEVQASDVSVDTNAKPALLPRADPQQQAFEEFLDYGVGNGNNFSDEEYLDNIRKACTGKWPNYNFFVINLNFLYDWTTDNDDLTMIAEVHRRGNNYQVVMFRCGGVLQKVWGDGGYANWNMQGYFVSEDNGNRAVFSAPP